MGWIAAVVLIGFAALLTVSMLRGGKLGRRWYSGGRSWNERDTQGTPVEPTDNVRSKQWG